MKTITPIIALALCGCASPRPDPVDATALNNAITESQQATTQARNHVTAAQSDADRIDAKATVILKYWK